MATEKQLSFISTLARERVLAPEVRARLDRKQASFDVRTASETIAWLLSQPKQQPPQQQSLRVGDGPAIILPSEASIARAIQAAVPEGRYAIERDGVTKFYQVDKPKDGKWAGRTFVSVQASDDKYPVRDAIQRSEILKAIAVDVKGAMLAYGLKLGKCGHCGRTLTDETSRARGIGPICAAKMDW